MSNGDVVIIDDDGKDYASPSGTTQDSAMSAVCMEHKGVQSLVSMGFDHDLARECLRNCNGNVEQAVEHLIGSFNGPKVTDKGECCNSTNVSITANKTSRQGTRKSSSQSITSYFSRHR
mmetsp:Transcript_28669/g.44565  ORF Transcript_28669/g.44565 Transcript_28669/m.44565 type:complete len:119 (-) Transcript_28669:12-368(-)